MPPRFLHFVDAPTTLVEVLKQSHEGIDRTKSTTHTHKYTCVVLYLQYLQRLIIEVEQDGAALDDTLRKLVKVDLL